MATAILENPTAKRTKREATPMRKLAQPVSKGVCHATRICTTCKPILRKNNKKKKPIRMFGCWRVAFRGTLNF